MAKKSRSLAKDRRGQSLVEYALILALVALAAIAALIYTGSQTNGVAWTGANAIANVEP
jgi:Flp pilus assembly pilin Flp